MNYPMKEGQIDPAFVEKISAKTDWMRHYEVKKVLLAAQEVMQELRTNIKVGDRVRMGDDFGRVHDCEFPEIDEREHAFVIFDDGERGIYLHEHLTKIEEAKHE